MTTEIFKRREQAFEAEYFARQDRKLIERIHAQREQQQDLSALGRITGISNESLLQEILDLGLGPHNLQMLSIVPLVVVGWASGKVEKEQKRAILEAAREDGLCAESGSQEILESWLDRPLDPKLVHAWKEVLHSVLDGLDPDGRERLRAQWLERAERVAKASSGILGLPKISKQERAALDDVERYLSV